MTITLPKELEKLVEREVAEGRFASAEDLVAKAVRAQLDELAAFRRTLDEAEAEGERLGWLSLEELDHRLAKRSKA
jgi:Arc/MetJ-type ribon-helix-helix transcriptional regulator